MTRSGEVAADRAFTDAEHAGDRGVGLPSTPPTLTVSTVRGRDPNGPSRTAGSVTALQATWLSGRQTMPEQPNWPPPFDLAAEADWVVLEVTAGRPSTVVAYLYDRDPMIDEVGATPLVAIDCWNLDDGFDGPAVVTVYDGLVRVALPLADVAADANLHLTCQLMWPDPPDDPHGNQGVWLARARVQDSRPPVAEVLAQAGTRPGGVATDAVVAAVRDGRTGR